jgi:hypothetical protein
MIRKIQKHGGTKHEFQEAATCKDSPSQLSRLRLFLQIPLDLKHWGVNWHGFKLRITRARAVVGGDEALYSGSDGGIDEDSLVLDGRSGHRGNEPVDTFERGSQGLQRCEVYFDNVGSCVVCSWLLGSCENRDLEVCIDKCLEDMRPKASRSLVKVSVISINEFFESLTPAIATDVILDMVKKVGSVLEFYIKRYVGKYCGDGMS